MDVTLQGPVGSLSMGDLFGEIALFTGDHRTANANASNARGTLKLAIMPYDEIPNIWKVSTSSLRS
jgi:hypothetical protein